MKHEARVKLLYKTIFRLHRGDCLKQSKKKPFDIKSNLGLPAEVQPLGNNYARDEFKRHKKCNEAEAAVFMVEWTNYAVQLSKQLGLGIKGSPQDKIGVPLRENDIDHLRDEQVVQLYELMKAATEEPDKEEDKKTIDKVEIIDNHVKKT